MKYIGAYIWSVLSPLAIAAPGFVLAEGPRQLEAHEHGVGSLNIAFDSTSVAMEFRAPGADIVGFEYPAESAGDRAAIDAAMATLSDPLALFVMPAEAGCALDAAELEVEGGEDDDGHDQDDHDDDMHAEGAGHTSFHGVYAITCSNPNAATTLRFAYFETFPNAQEVQVQMVSASGAMAFDVERAAPVLDLGR